MNIRLLEIEDNLFLKGEIEAFHLVNQLGGDYRLNTPVHYGLALKKLKNGIKIKGLIECSVSLVCSRCLEDFTFPIKADVDLKLIPANAAPERLEVELKKEDMDTYYYEGNEIDLEPLINEEIMLNIPIRQLCSETCRGLCEICGKNLNYEECNCNKTSSTILGEELKNYLARQGEDYASPKKKDLAVKKR